VKDAFPVTKVEGSQVVVATACHYLYSASISLSTSVSLTLSSLLDYSCSDSG
jgi:hypothetical protein